MISVVLDFNCLISLNNENSDRMKDKQLVEKIINLQKQGLCEVYVLGISMSENDSQLRKLSDFLTFCKQHGIKQENILSTIGFFGLTILDYSIILDLNQESSQLYLGQLKHIFDTHAKSKNIDFILSKNKSDKEIKKWINHMSDSLAIWTTLFYKKDIIISADKQLRGIKINNKPLILSADEFIKEHESILNQIKDSDILPNISYAKTSKSTLENLIIKEYEATFRINNKLSDNNQFEKIKCYKIEKNNTGNLSDRLKINKYEIIDRGENNFVMKAESPGYQYECTADKPFSDKVRIKIFNGKEFIYKKFPVPLELNETILLYAKTNKKYVEFNYLIEKNFTVGIPNTYYQKDQNILPIAEINCSNAYNYIHPNMITCVRAA